MPAITGEDFRPTALLSPGGSQPPPAGSPDASRSTTTALREIPAIPWPRRHGDANQHKCREGAANPSRQGHQKGHSHPHGAAPTSRTPAGRIRRRHPAPAAARQQADRKPKGRRQTIAAPQSTTMASNAAARPQVAARTEEVACTVQTPDLGETSPDPG
jgi:hypothetical protein